MLDLPSVQTLVYYIGWLHLGLEFVAGLWLVYFRVAEWAERLEWPAWDGWQVINAWRRERVFRSGAWGWGVLGYGKPWRVRR